MRLFPISALIVSPLDMRRVRPVSACSGAISRMYLSTACATVTESSTNGFLSLMRSRVSLAHISAIARVRSCLRCRCPLYLTVANQPPFFFSKCGIGHYRATRKVFTDCISTVINYLLLFSAPLAGERLQPLGHLSVCNYIHLAVLNYLGFPLILPSGPLAGHLIAVGYRESGSIAQQEKTPCQT